MAIGNRYTNNTSDSRDTVQGDLLVTKSMGITGEALRPGL